ncbi:tripartite tricarboxylate transporter substrate-binding protein [Curvibacter sp. CHRR-16]|uniref:Bug family tripartite tricarboxylate transporter substrate binding protein n=1 Tax=Curvibacter sp. CHRR-16 TaxID=2835872 RepID=UPI002023B628|nr:tripartite tricarboxylate transporter substrate-binding protein [Curvibacter sp. CHRR-16]
MTGLAGAALSSMGLPASAASTTAAPVNKLANKLHIVIPANPGGGWDQFGHRLGEALRAADYVSNLEYENIPGKGGVIGLAHYAQHYSADPDVLLIGGSVMEGAIALHKPAVNLKSVQPLARLASDYMVVLVKPDSPMQSPEDAIATLRRDGAKVVIAGGSAGGIDHIYAGFLLRTAGLDASQMSYLPFAGGKEIVDAVLSGKATLAVSGFSESKDLISSGKLRALGISSPKPFWGLLPMKKAGVAIDIANWRGVFTGSQVSAQRKLQMVEALKATTAMPVWQNMVQQNGWQSSWSSGADFEAILDIEAGLYDLMVSVMRLKP